MAQPLPAGLVELLSDYDLEPYFGPDNAAECRNFAEIEHMGSEIDLIRGDVAALRSELAGLASVLADVAALGELRALSTRRFQEATHGFCSGALDRIRSLEAHVGGLYRRAAEDDIAADDLGPPFVGETVLFTDDKGGEIVATITQLTGPDDEARADLFLMEPPAGNYAWDIPRDESAEHGGLTWRSLPLN